MKINIAGAGAGKTYTLAEKILAASNNNQDDKRIFCITYTNNAAECIKNRIIDINGDIPKNVLISTIHSFLYSEVIKPYYKLLYGVMFERISRKKISSTYKNAEFKRMEANGVLHVDAVTERAKWIIVKKSTDSASDKKKRKVILNSISKYIGYIFVDESQDIDENVYLILKQFDNLGIRVEVMGDPKQDLKGFGNLSKLEHEYPADTNYINECYRCPQVLLNLSNSIVEKQQQQKSLSKNSGSLEVIFENEIIPEKYIEENNFDLMYISKKHSRYSTHLNTQGIYDPFESVLNEIIPVYFSNISKTILERAMYYFAREMYKEYQKENNIYKTIRLFAQYVDGGISKQHYAILSSQIESCFEENGSESEVIVSSIESVKGLEGDKCLFILTEDLAPYLFQEKSAQNKMKNLLYVALTRSSDKLVILICKEVEAKYGSKFILDYLTNITEIEIMTMGKNADLGIK